MNIQLFDFSVDLLQAILWQYNDATRLQSLLSQKQGWYNENQTQFWTDWYNNVFNLETANDFGLAVWSIILNIPLQITPNPDPPDKPIFGFGPYHKNFNNGNFAIGSNSFSLTTEEKRLILRLRYFQLTSRTSIPVVNNILDTLFKNENGTAYLLDGLNMTIRLVFTYDVGERLLYILQKYDLIPRDAGVELTYIVATKNVFGFGPFYKNFNNGNFAEEA
jgi:hypothetical protein